MRRLFLHVGLPKCATTTVQNYLAAERAALSAAGLHYDFPPGLDRPHEGNGVLLANAVLARRPDEAAAQLAFHLSQGSGDVLISSEVFSALFQTRGMTDLVQSARNAGYAPRVIIYLRRQDLWVESDYKQQIKGGRGWADPIEALIEQRIAQLVLNHAWTLAYWAKHVGRENLHVIALHPGQAADHPVRALLAACGVDAGPAPIPVPAANVSPPTGLIEPARLIKRALIASGGKPDAVREALERFFHHAPRLLEVPARRFLLTHASRAALVARFRGSNADVARDYLGGQGFGSELEQDPASEADLFAEAEGVLAEWRHATRRAGLDETARPLGLMARLGLRR